MVDPRQCPRIKPNRISQCNRIPCPAKWVSTGRYFIEIQKHIFKRYIHVFFNSFIGWSDCTTTCGTDGLQKMKFDCQPPDNEVFFDCGMEPISVRKCLNNPQCPSVGKKQYFLPVMQ